MGQEGLDLVYFLNWAGPKQEHKPIYVFNLQIVFAKLINWLDMVLNLKWD